MLTRKQEKTRAEHRRRAAGMPLKNYQISGKQFTFRCGCSGILPKKGKSDQFARWQSKAHQCRVAQILSSSGWHAKRRGHKPVDSTTSHAIIRNLMKLGKCERCGQPLDWNNLGRGKTPNLHHNHETGEIHGFTHPVCNAQALEKEIDKLKEQIRRIKIVLEEQATA
jgi:hypothetical protein